jgi:diacylglycerol O-acyltransferase / wax synthase
MDAAILNVEDPTAPDTMGLLLLFDGKLDEQALLAQIERRWLEYPRYRQRIRKRPLGRMQWVADPTFDLRSHVRRVAVPAPHDTDALRRTVGDLMAMLMDRSRPLWSMHIIEGGPGGDALLIRMHHAIGDGMTLLKTSLSLIRDMPVPEEPRRTIVSRLLDPVSDVIDATQSMSNWMKEQVEHGLPRPGEILAGAEQAVGLGVKLFPLVQDPRTILTGPLTRRKAVAWTPPVPAKDFKRLARAFDVSVHDLVLAVITGALRRYLISQDQKIPRQLHASVPVYLGSPQSPKTGNNFGLTLVPLPLGEPEPLKRIRTIHETMEQLKKSPEAAISATVFNTAGRFPQGLVSRLFVEVSRKVSLIVTTVPGPPTPQKLAGATLRHVVPLVPLSGYVGLGIAITTYNRHLSLGIQADAGRIKPSMRAFIELLRAEHALLTSLAEDGEEAPADQPRQCVALTLQGKRCRNRARKGARTCYSHRGLEEPAVERAG